MELSSKEVMKGFKVKVYRGKESSEEDKSTHDEEPMVIKGTFVF
jgi:hypothetical protein